MITGILLIICGVLIAVYPQLLSVIVASFMIILGLIIVLAALAYRRYGDKRRARIVEYIFRY